MRVDAVGDFRGELVPPGQDMAAPGDQAAAVAFDQRQGAEAIVLDFVQPVGMVERLRDPNERHRSWERQGALRAVGQARSHWRASSS